MGQRVADQIGVEQRGDRTDARYPKPNREILGTVRHHQADDIAGRETLSMRPAGIASGPLSQRAVGQDFSRRQQRGASPNCSPSESMSNGKVCVGFCAIGAVFSSARTHALSSGFMFESWSPSTVSGAILW